jgi:hypothetical protein
MRYKINQTDEIAKLDQERAKEDLKRMKQSDYENFIDNKNLKNKNRRQADKDYVDRQVATDEAKMYAERQRKEAERDILKNVLISQILDKNQRATAASLRFPEV